MRCVRLVSPSSQHTLICYYCCCFQAFRFIIEHASTLLVDISPAILNAYSIEEYPQTNKELAAITPNEWKGLTMAVCRTAHKNFHKAGAIWKNIKNNNSKILLPEDVPARDGMMAKCSTNNVLKFRHPDVPPFTNATISTEFLELTMFMEENIDERTLSTR